jgi:hypothetical protein
MCVFPASTRKHQLSLLSMLSNCSSCSCSNPEALLERNTRHFALTWTRASFTLQFAPAAAASTAHHQHTYQSLYSHHHASSSRNLQQCAPRYKIQTHIAPTEAALKLCTKILRLADRTQHCCIQPIAALKHRSCRPACSCYADKIYALILTRLRWLPTRKLSQQTHLSPATMVNETHSPATNARSQPTCTTQQQPGERRPHHHRSQIVRGLSTTQHTQVCTSSSEQFKKQLAGAQAATCTRKPATAAATSSMPGTTNTPHWSAHSSMHTTSHVRDHTCCTNIHSTRLHGHIITQDGTPPQNTH